MHDNLLELDTHFDFGRNWLSYADKIDETAIAHAMAALRRLLGEHTLENQSFLDVGCGSGLHSLAALRLGASRVCGVDLDPDSVAAATKTIQRFAPGAAATFKVYSVFDMTPGEFGGFDVVYSWGVLHHTGDMVRAVKTAASLVKPEGQLCLALYKRTPLCPAWRVIKRWYSRSSPNAQRKARTAFTSLTRLTKWLKGVDFDRFRREYSDTRGMDFENDQHDWLGGYPYESISPSRCRTLVGNLGFVLEREFIQSTGYLPGLTGSGCDEYVFRRMPSAARTDN